MTKWYSEKQLEDLNKILIKINEQSKQLEVIIVKQNELLELLKK